MAAVALGLTSSLCGGLADFFGGIQTRRHSVLTVLFVSQVIALLGAIVIVVASGRPEPGGLWALYASLAGLSISVALGSLYRGLAIGTMTLVAPVASTGAVVPVLYGLANGERPGTTALMGIACAVAGLVVVARPGSAVDEVTTRRREGLALALMSACGFGGFFISMGAAADADPLWALLGSRISFVALMGAAALVMARPVAVGLKEMPPMIWIGLLDMCATGSFAVATTLGLLGVVSVLSSFPPLVTVIMARAVLHERVGRTRGVGVGVTICGVALIAAG